MWYLAELLFAQDHVPESIKRMYMCETSNVLFDAESAKVAYEKAIKWGNEHIQESIISIKFVGVTKLIKIDEERPSDGSELFGNMFRMKDVWDRKNRIIPEINQLSAMIYENNSDVPIQDLIEEKRGKSFLTSLKEMDKRKG